MSIALDIAKNFKALYSNLESAALVAVNNAARYTRDKLSVYSPVKTGRYRRSWRFTRAKVRSDSSVWASVFNPISYGYWIEEGAENPNTYPFWGHGPRTITGSFWGSDLRIWSTQAPGGPIQRFMNGQQSEKLLDALARDVIKGIKW